VRLIDLRGNGIFAYLGELAVACSSDTREVSPVLDCALCDWSFPTLRGSRFAFCFSCRCEFVLRCLYRSV
jgi:hypothetical protein